VLQGDLTPLIYVAAGRSHGAHAAVRRARGYLLGVGMVRPWLRLAAGIAGLAFQLFPGLVTTLIGGSRRPLIVAVIWRDNRNGVVAVPWKQGARGVTFARRPL